MTPNGLVDKFIALERTAYMDIGLLPILHKIPSLEGTPLSPPPLDTSYFRPTQPHYPGSSIGMW